MGVGVLVVVVGKKGGDMGHVDNCVCTLVAKKEQKKCKKILPSAVHLCLLLPSIVINKKCAFYVNGPPLFVFL